MVRQFAKSALALLPAPLDLYASDAIRWLSSAAFREKRRRNTRIRASLASPDVVAFGLFEGMRYPLTTSAQGGLLPKLIGTYEQELHAPLSRIATTPIDRIVDIGCAEGFYAVGLARLIPSASMVAFEMETPLHSAVRQLAAANSVLDRLSLRGTCTPTRLRGSLAGAKVPLVLCDCEGAEDFLIDPDAIPELRLAAIVCEMHDSVRPGVTQRMRGRFESSHEIQSIPTIARRAVDVPVLRDLSDDDARFAMDEGRAGPMEWLVMLPRTRA